MRHQFVRLLRGGVETDGRVHLIALLERHLRVAAVDRRGRGEYELGDLRRMSAAFQHVEESLDVRLLVDEGVRDGIPHARLGGEVEHHVRHLRGERFPQSFEIADVEFARGEARPVRPFRRKARGAVALEGHVVVVAEVVDAGDVPAAAQ